MMRLTDVSRLARLQSNRTKRTVSNKDIRVYNRKAGVKYNGFAGDTTNLPHGVDNRTDNLELTEDEILDSVLNPNKKFRVKASDIKLSPDCVSDEVRMYWLQKINQSGINMARAGKESNTRKSVHDMFTLDRSSRDLYDWNEVL